MIYKFSVHRLHGDLAPSNLRRRIPDLLSWRDYYIELPESLGDSELRKLAESLIEPLTERVEVGAALQPGTQVQVAYKRGIVDNENNSILGLCHMLGLPAIAAKVATTYESDDPQLAKVIDEQACNHNIEEMHVEELHFDSLLPHGTYSPVATYDLRNLDDDELIDLGAAGGRVLDLDKMRTIRDIQVRLGLDTVTDVMLGALDARWSDHCAHTTWKSLGNLLGKLIDASTATENPNIVSMFYDNAGIWDFYEGYGIAVKAETHNGPSGVSAYFGLLTKVGGVLRDILGTGLGADPIGVFEYTATGLPGTPAPIADRPDPKHIAHETIRAVKEYGNTFGVPMMSSHMAFHPAYRAKPFALGGSIGLIPLEYAKKGDPVAGDHVLLIGGLTGNDGIHGASGSSAGAVMDTTSVQIGSPIEAIKFRQAILELRDRGCIRAITDLGAAGLNSAVGEMGETTGVWMNTALVPLKTGGLPMWRILLSESQERMIMAIPPEKLDEARRILTCHEVRNTVVGRFTGHHRYCVVHDPAIDEHAVVTMNVDDIPVASEIGFDLPYDALRYRPPALDVSPAGPEEGDAAPWPQLQIADLATVVESVLADFEVCDQSLASTQYDSSVMSLAYHGPVIGEFRPGIVSNYFAARPLYDSNAALVFNWEFNPWLFEAGPVSATRQTLLSVLTGQVLAGVKTIDISLTDNFYTPHLTDNWAPELVGMVEELASLTRTFRTPLISGKDSSAGSTQTDEGMISVPSGVLISGLGKVPDVARLRPEQWQSPGNLLVRIGVPTPSPAGTVAARVGGFDGGRPDVVDVERARSFLSSLERIGNDLIVSGRVIGNGGLIATAVLTSLASDLSADFDVDATEALQEHRCAALVEVSAGRLSQLPSELNPVVVGRITGAGRSVKVRGVEMLTDQALQKWSTSFAEALS